MSLGKITTRPCVTEPPGTDPRCADEAFALSHPDVCPPTPRLVIRPSFVLACALGSVQFRASYFDENFIETDVTDQTTFQTSNPDIAVIGAASGNATGLSTGTAAISGTYQALTAFAEMTVLGGDCCDDHNVAMMVMVDRTRSMKQAFSAGYATKLDFAKAAAERFIGEVNEQKDLIGLMTFTADGYEVLSPPIANKAAVVALVPGITQTQQLTTFYDGLTAAIASLNTVTADLKVIVLISDGEDKDDSYSTEDNPITLLTGFKDTGGIVMTIGVRSHDFGYNLLSAFSTGGFFLNGHDTVAQATLDYMSGLKGYICAGNCTPPGDTFEPSGSLNYCGLTNWNVVDGHVDLMGNGFLDLLPGNGLYLDLAGSRAEYKGRLESKNSYAVTSGKTYGFQLRLAGNQRVDDEPNTVRVKAYARDTDTIATPVAAPTVDAANGSGLAELETYEYAYSYVNANGETELSPAATGDNGGFSTFSVEVDAPASGTATLVRFYKREQGTTQWYRVAESAPAAPAFTDTRNNAALASAVAAGTVDACDKPSDDNRTGTPIVIFQQDVTIDDFREDFTTHHLEFEASATATVWLSIQQLETPTGYDATGLLLDSVIFENITDDIVLLEEDFDDENVVYVPPACGLGTNYVLLGGGFMSGTAGVDPIANPAGPDAGGFTLAAVNDGAGNMTDTEYAYYAITYVTANGETRYSSYQAWGSQILSPNDAITLTFPALHPTVTQIRIWRQDSDGGSLAFPANAVRMKLLDTVVAGTATYTDIMSNTDWYAQAAGQTETVPTENTTGVAEVPSSYAGTSYGYASGYSCYGEGCLDEPPAVQSEDPSPLSDIEGPSTPPEIFTASATVVRSCAEGYLYVPSTFLAAATTVSQCGDGGTAPVAGLDGARIEIPVDRRDEWTGFCLPPPPQNVLMRGASGTTYNVTLRLRGVTEGFTGYNPYFPYVPLDNSTAEAGPVHFVASQALPNPYTPPEPEETGFFMIVYHTSSGYQWYNLNRYGTPGIPVGETAPWACYLMDYTVTIPLVANASVSLRGVVRPGSGASFIAFANLGRDRAAGGEANYQPIVVPGIRNGGSTIPDTTPFPGQFIQMDVISVVAQ